MNEKRKRGIAPEGVAVDPIVVLKGDHSKKLASLPGCSTS